MLRRAFLKGVAATPVLAVLAAVAPAAAQGPHHWFMKGDLVAIKGEIIYAQPVLAASPDGMMIQVSRNYYRHKPESDWFSVDRVSLFEGLPGNRVNNPSMRHRLAPRGPIGGLAYPGDKPLGT